MTTKASPCTRKEETEVEEILVKLNTAKVLGGDCGEDYTAIKLAVTQNREDVNAKIVVKETPCAQKKSSLLLKYTSEVR